MIIGGSVLRNSRAVIFDPRQVAPCVATGELSSSSASRRPHSSMRTTGHLHSPEEKAGFCGARPMTLPLYNSLMHPTGEAPAGDWPVIVTLKTQTFETADS